MHNNEEQQKISEEEEFRLAYHSFICELEALSQSVEIACEMENYYNVAYEFWYLVPNAKLLENSQGLLSEAQLSALERLFDSIKSLPEEAYKWTTIAEESLQNMHHPAWGPIREQAVKLKTLLAPITKSNNEYFSNLKH